MTPFVWKNALRTEIVTTGHGVVISYGLDGKELWRVDAACRCRPRRRSRSTACSTSAPARRGTPTGRSSRSSRAPRGDISLKPGETSNEFIVWSHPRASGYTPSALVHDGRAYLVHDTGILTVLDAKTGKQIYKVRVGGGGQTFSASPVAAGDRVLLLTEEGMTFVLDGRRRVQGDRAERSRRDVARVTGDRGRRDLHPHRIEALQDSKRALS